MRISLNNRGIAVHKSLAAIENYLIEMEFHQEEAFEILLEASGDWYHCLTLLLDPGVEVQLETDTDVERIFKLAMRATGELTGDAWKYFQVFSRMARFDLLALVP